MSGIRIEVTAPNQPGPLVNPPGTLLGHYNALMASHHLGASRRRRFYEQAKNFEGPLSLKVVLRGRGHWQTSTKCFTLDEGFSLLLGAGETCTVTFDLASELETFCPFFEIGFAEEVARTISSSPDALLADPDGPRPALALAPHVRPLDGALLSPLRALRRLSQEIRPDPLAWDHAFRELAQSLLGLSPHWQVEHGNAIRPSTRAEITRRINRARDFIHAAAHRSITLVDIAEASALSPHHLHRLFRRALKITPADYVSTLRLGRTERLLAQTDMPVTDICAEVGFASLGTFSSLFKRRFGVPPSAFRKNARSKKRSASGSSSLLS